MTTRKGNAFDDFNVNDIDELTQKLGAIPTDVCYECGAYLSNAELRTPSLTCRKCRKEIRQTEG